MRTKGEFMKISAPRGTSDVLPQDSYKWHYIEMAARRIAATFGYKEIRTPIFEHTELFTRGIGKGSDIVRKEMYTFEDKKGRSMTLRPEGTATVMRSVLQNNLYLKSPLKLFYLGPFFRYERPQEGRFRQFNQFGLEAIGLDDASIDAEIILAACSLFTSLDLKHLQVQLNSLGCSSCRPNYREALISFFDSRIDKLCSDCQERFKVNPLRILDCKNPDCKNIADSAPSTLEFLCESCKNDFLDLEQILKIYEIDFTINPKIVRGLDYYTKTVFEITSGQLGSQDAICGGGRYNGLAEEIGGKSIPAVGFAAGIERLLALMQKTGSFSGIPVEPRVFVISIEDSCRLKALEILYALRKNGIHSEFSYGKKNIKKILGSLGEGTEFVYIIGSDELAAGTISVKNMKTKCQVEIPALDAVNFISRGNL